MAYDTKAQEFAYGFFARGWSKERCLKEIRKVYPGLSGSTYDEWVERLGWRERRAAADAKAREFADSARDMASTLLMELDTVRKQLFSQVKGGAADTQTIYAYTSVTKQIADITKWNLANRDGERVAVDVLYTAIEKLLAEARALPGLGTALEQNAARVGELVTQVVEEFGLAPKGAAAA